MTNSRASIEVLFRKFKVAIKRKPVAGGGLGAGWSESLFNTYIQYMQGSLTTYYTCTVGPILRCAYFQPGSEKMKPASFFLSLAITQYIV